MKVKPLRGFKMVFRGKTYFFKAGEAVELPSEMAFKMLANPRLSKMLTLEEVG